MVIIKRYYFKVAFAACVFHRENIKKPITHQMRFSCGKRYGIQGFPSRTFVIKTSSYRNEMTTGLTQLK